MSDCSVDESEGGPTFPRDFKEVKPGDLLKLLDGSLVRAVDATVDGARIPVIYEVSYASRFDTGDYRLVNVYDIVEWTPRSRE